MSEPPTLFDRPTHRRSDPETSRRAARVSRSRAAGIVFEIMRDGIPRIDEEIHAAAADAGHKITADRIRHGRLELVDIGVLEQDGEVATSVGARSRRWKLAGAGGAA